MFLIIIAVIIIFLIFHSRKPKNFPRGPRGLPIIGNLLILAHLDRLKFHHLLWNELAKIYGCVVGLKFFHKNVIIISSKEMVRKLYRNENLQGRPEGFFFKIRTFEERLGIVFTDQEFWDTQRTLSVKILKSLGFGRSNMILSIQYEAENLMKILRENFDNQEICIQENNKNIFDIPVINVLWKMIKGQRFDLNDQKANFLMEMIHRSFTIVDMSGGLLNFFPSIRHVFPHSSGYQPLVDTLKHLWDFLETSIDDEWKNYNDENPPNNFIQFYIKENLHGFNKRHLLALLVDFFQAGSETTSNTLSFSILYMLHYPKVLKKVRREIDDKLRGKFPSLNDRIELKYCEAVLNEIQRMSNVAPLGIAHRALEDVHITDDCVIPKDSTVLFNLFSVHMDESYWGDAEIFRPERFLDRDELIQHESFIPFGAGKRRCIGENLARSSLFIFFVAFIQSFNFSFVGEIPSLEGSNGITLAPQSYKIFIKSRQN